ncbi:MAG: B12-binding domain-containing radical SAM protein [Acidobacteria bacterium]|nr:B12-binding domain-containing radical SAM protein [Acidobacteriota bacterium]
MNPAGPDAYWTGRASLPFARRRALLPPLGLITVAALLPPSWECRLVDMNVEPLRDADIAAADVVLVTGMLVQRPSMQEVLGRCRALGVRTLVGGPYATALPGELEGADHIVQGEAEDLVPRVAAALELRDAARIYREERKPDLAAAPVPRYDLLARRAYHQTALQFSRGCPHSCEFCDIVALFGHTPRVKTPAQVVAELDAIRATGFSGDVFFVDDNFIGNRRAVRSLLPVISSWQRRTRARLGFYTEASMDLADDPALVDAMVDAGFSAVFLGIETPNPDALRETGKRQNLNGDPISRVHALLARGLDVWGGFILGFDSDGPDIFDRMVEFVRRASIPYAMVGMLGAPPGTALWKRLKGEGRLRAGTAFEGGDQFGLTNVISRLPAEQLVDGYRRVMDALYAPDSYFQRCRDNLARWSGRRAGARPVSLADLRAGLRAMIAQGVRGAYRGEYWRFLGWAAAHHPRKLATAIRQAAAGHHYITYTRETVLPALQRTRAELAAAAANAAAAATAAAALAAGRRCAR